MVDVDGPRRREPTEDSVVKVWAANHASGANFYLEPGEELEIRDDSPNLIRVSPIASLTEGGDDGA